MLLRALMFILLGGFLTAASADAGTLSPGLETLLDSHGDKDQIKVLVVLRDHPDVRAMDKAMYREGISRQVRHESVVRTLRDAAQASQADLVAALGQKKAAGQITGFVPHWIINAVVVTASVAEIRDLALRDDVERIEANITVETIKPVEVKAGGDRMDKGFVAPGLRAIQADRVWHELGFDGTGTIVGNLDSGVDGGHSALSGRWRGNFAPSAECWQDAAGVGSPNFPADPFGHGTHTMGTITGASFVDTVGVAPGARWIASNAIATAEGLDNAIIQAFEWFADPDGNPATVDDVPDVVQNSWGVNPSSGQYLDCDTRWWDVIDNCEAAGVVTIWSAGNEGPTPSSLRSPPNRADTPTSSFAVGSVRTTFPYQISNFSSRGPSKCGGPFAVKPEVVAPGQDILSSVPGGLYAYMSGTSMAGPHVAGVVALMRQAKPDLDVDTIKEILLDTSRDLGVVGEDNTYGNGLIDAYAAVLVALNEIGSVSGTITDSVNGLPVAGVEVRDTLGLGVRTTGADGAFTFTLRSGERPLSAAKFGYFTSLETVTIPAGLVQQHDIVLERTPWSRVSGTVRDGAGNPVAGAEIVVLDTPVDPVYSAADGTFEVYLPSGEGFAYQLKAALAGLAYDLRNVGLEQEAFVDFDLPAIQGDGFESGDFSAFLYTQTGQVAWTVDTEESHEGSLSARSGAIADNESSTLALDYYVNGEGTFSFWVKTDSEIVYDTVSLAIDGTVVGSWSGDTPWTQFQMELTTGMHAFAWTFQKDDSVGIGRDSAWIDEIRFPGTGVQPFAQFVATTPTVATQIAAGSLVDFPVTIGNAGGASLIYGATVGAVGDAGTPLNWVTVSPANGSVFPFNDSAVMLHFDGFRAPTGVHQAQLDLVSNDPSLALFSVPITLTVTAVSAVGQDLPRQVTFVGAVPNPFNPTTNLSFVLPEATRARLRIYDAQGHLVRDLVDATLVAGRHEVTWNGRTNEGQGAASGVYFARLQAGNKTETKGLTLIR